MRLLVRFLLAASLCCSVHAQVYKLSREEMIQFTAKSPYERFPDGRPKVPDAVLKKMEDLSAEEIWSVLKDLGFHNQFEGNWQIVHPERKLIGRAVTAQFMPLRPDVRNVIEERANGSGMKRNANQRVIDSLQLGDVVVADLFGKMEGGTYVGDNLATAVYEFTKTGLVVDGAVRDLDGIFDIPMGLYIRGSHPSAINEVMLTGVNIPVRIGAATVMPGDIVFGDREGIYFVPPELIGKILEKAEETHIHDEWTKMMLHSGKYKSSDIYPSPQDPELKRQYEQFRKQKLGAAAH